MRARPCQSHPAGAENNGEEVLASFGLLSSEQRPGCRGSCRSSYDERITELQRLKVGLTQCTGCGCLSIDRCRLANPEDRAARFGPGPRYWVGDRPPGREPEAAPEPATW